ncbi:LOW QUALITY PROTEIN: inactive glucose-1-phosphate adenylyltransferase small subunit 2, chloroplastic [Alnus glutinosa]|uniref:LOW QUALITY PROTEIN: inactive glucose-1-phosphate adenylyltransferase small subunit 2, chloroplastic n=1 Tax=Alnus glutinosa TaxID=3517 RepID=UPI002D78DECD|nr:LOW QUALITY PROTEIN: inactive glucose-1-phosphate adenylyltransferase small subunit 2, chloroplastic [Alnus glutinosa]
MVILQLSLPTPIPQTNGSFAGLASISKKSSSKFHSTLPPRLFISNSQQPQYPISLSPPANQSVAAIVFGDGSESRLYPLTKRRSEGAIPIAANYRLVDAVVSNCINSNINKIYALTQFNSTSLNSHLSRIYSGVGLGKEGFVEVIAAYQSLEDKGWFQGAADAVRRCLWVMEEYPVSEFLILPGHHLYKMDYQKIIEAHRKSKSDITIAALSALRDQDTGFGFLKVNSENQVLEFRLKSESEPTSFVSVSFPPSSSLFWFYHFSRCSLRKFISEIQVESSRNCNDIAYCNLSSMGIYLINRDIIVQLLKEHFPKANDFTGEAIPGAISIGMKIQAFIFDGYWEDMRSIEAFYQANMESTKKANMGFNSFFDKESPIYTLPRVLPPTHLTDAVIIDSVIGDGCILGRCKLKGAVVGTRTRVGDGAVIEDSVIMGSDIYQMEGSQRSGMDRKAVDIPIGIGEDTQIRKAIVDKGARIGKNVLIINKDNVQEGNNEANGYVISGGIVVVLPSAVIPDGSIL